MDEWMNDFIMESLGGNRAYKDYMLEDDIRKSQLYLRYSYL